MDVRSQISMVFHLDKCIGCHTCSIACKNVWTDRKGAEYMWWNNVETKPGTGYPTAWEDQDRYGGGWQRVGSNGQGLIQLRVNGPVRGLANIFHNPNLPIIDDYYEPWTYRYSDLFDSPAGDDQPTARAISMITGKPMEIRGGPNWDDDLSGSPKYAANDPNLTVLTPAQREQLFEVERLVFFYLPRICNHCLNPACVAACPSGALYKRGEDGIVLLNQNRCRAWRQCVSACPYKKTYFNWAGGKSEKCILCYPRLETGQAPACFHSCVGRIRYLGVLLYDADAIAKTAGLPDAELIEGQRRMVLDPGDPEVVREAVRSGIDASTIESAQRSPVYRFVKEWKLALPLHIEHRTLPMLFYVPPLLPILGSTDDKAYDTSSEALFGTIEQARLPIAYLASLFGAGDASRVRYVLRKLLAVRHWRRAETVGDMNREAVHRVLAEADCTPEEANAIYRLTSLPTFEQRFVIPPAHREEAIASLDDPLEFKGFAGLGSRVAPKRAM